MIEWFPQQSTCARFYHSSRQTKPLSLVLGTSIDSTEARWYLILNQSHMVGYLVFRDSLIAFYLQYAVHTITVRISPILYCRIDISTIKSPRNATPTRKYSTGFMQAGNTKPIGQFGVTKFHVYCFFFNGGSAVPRPARTDQVLSYNMKE